MNWPEAFALFACFVGVALIFNGFPNIKIGGKHTYVTKNYSSEEDDEDDE